MGWIEDEKEVAEVIKRLPGITPFQISWVLGGGDVEAGEAVGMIDRISPTVWARCMRVSSRILKLKKSAIVKTGKPRATAREGVKGYYPFAFNGSTNGLISTVANDSSYCSEQKKKLEDRSKHLKLCSHMPDFMQVALGRVESMKWSCEDNRWTSSHFYGIKLLDDKYLCYAPSKLASDKVGNVVFLRAESFEHAKTACQEHHVSCLNSTLEAAIEEVS